MVVEEIHEFIGFDFGDAESALTRMSSSSLPQQSPEEIVSAFAGTQNGIIRTVLGYCEDGATVVGCEAATSQCLKDDGLYLGFKMIPRRGDESYAKLVIDFINAILDRLENEKLVNPKASKFIIGYPSKWKDVNGGEPVEVMKGILAKTRLGQESEFDLVPESRGAMIEAIMGGLINRKVLESGWCLLIDLGSSTVDFTAINVGQRDSRPIDFGEELGARLIDQLIADSLISQSQEKDEIEHLFNLYPWQRKIFELKCREFKEMYFSSKQCVARYNPIHGGQVYPAGINVSLTLEVMKELTSQREVIEIDNKKESWESGFMILLQKSGKMIKDKFQADVKSVLLVGGASRMPFVREICAKVFPDAVIAQAGNPSFTIAKGLARFGCIQMHTVKFASDIQEFCRNSIRSKVEKSMDDVFNNVAKSITASAIIIMKEQFCGWRNGRIKTLEDMKEKITQTIESDIKSKLLVFMVIEIKKIITCIAKELAEDIKGIENKYGIKIGVLGDAFAAPDFNLRKIGLPDEIGQMDLDGGAFDVYLFLAGSVAAGVTVLFAIGPAGVLLGAILAVVAFLLGVGVGDVTIKGFDIPQWMRNQVDLDSALNSFDEKYNVIFDAVIGELNKAKDLHANVIDEIWRYFEMTLQHKAEDARILIS